MKGNEKIADELIGFPYDVAKAIAGDNDFSVYKLSQSDYDNNHEFNLGNDESKLGLYTKSDGEVFAHTWHEKRI